MNVKELLVAARAKVAHGWVRGVASVGDCVCAVEALRRARAETGSDEPSDFEAHRLALDTLYRSATASRSAPWLRVPVAIAHWQDAPERTQADVLAAYDRAIVGCT